MPKSKILVPAGFGLQSDAALVYAKKIALQLNQMITCLYVIEKPGFVTSKFISKELETKIRREAEMQLSSRVNRIYPDREKISFELIITAGKVHQKILEKSTELNANLIIMGRSDGSDLTRNYLGSNASQVISKATLPVVTVRNSRILSNAHVLLPLDLYNPVTIKIAKAIEVLQQQGSRVTICSILHPDRIILEPAYRTRLKEIKKLFVDYEIDCRVQLVISGNTLAAEILEVARKVQADEIMLMTQGEKDHTEMFIGSTAREVIKNSEIPVLSFTPGVQASPYPYRTLFGNINNPIRGLDINDHLLKK